MKKIIRFSLFICLALFFSCKKEKVSITPPPPAEFHFSNEGLQYIQLKEGAYFIYKDSTSGREDSVIVSSSTLKTQYAAESTQAGGTQVIPAFYYDQFTLILTLPKVGNKQWFSGQTPLYGSGIGINSEPSAEPIEMQDLITMSINYYTTHAFHFPPDNVSSFKIDDMTIGGVVYTNIIKTAGVIDYGEGNPETIYETTWWAKGVGIIKWQIRKNNQDQTFTLLRHG